MSTNKNANLLLVLVLVILSYFLIFFHLDTTPLAGWDESLYGMRMLYMNEHHSVLPSFRYFEGMGHPNHKPPLITIVQTLFYKVLGPDNHALSLRLPIGLCGLAFVLVNLWISKKEFGGYYLGAMASVILLTTAAFNRGHVMRTGDHDIFLSFFMYLALISAYYFLKSLKGAQRNYKALILAFVCLYLGFLTKSVVAFFVIPVIILFAIYSKTILPALKDKWVWVSIISLCLGVFGYFYLFELLMPDFNEALFHDGLGRFQTKMGISQPFSFFFEQMWEWGFVPYVYLLPLGIYYGFRKEMGLVQIMSIGWLVCLLIVSISESKHNWYSAPIYPMAAFVVAYAVREVTLLIKNNGAQAGKTLAIYLNIALIIGPICMTISKNYSPARTQVSERYGYMLKHMKNAQPQKEFTLLVEDGTPQAAFYIALYNQAYGYKINQEDNVKRISTPQVLVCDQKKKEALIKAYEAHTVFTAENCWYIEIDNF